MTPARKCRYMKNWMYFRRIVQSAEKYRNMEGLKKKFKMDVSKPPHKFCEMFHQELSPTPISFNTLLLKKPLFSELYSKFVYCILYGITKYLP